MAESNINVTPGSGGPNIDLEVVDNGNARQVIVIGDPATGAKTAPVDATLGLSVNPTALPPLAATSTKQSDGTQKSQVVDGSGNTVSSQANGSQRAMDVGIDVAGVQVDPRSIRTLTTADNVTSNEVPSTLVQSVTAATGVGVTVTLPAVAGDFHYITLIEITKYFTVANAASATPLVVTTTNLPGSLAFSFGQPLGTVGTTDERFYTSGTPLKSSVVNTATTIVCPAITGIIWRVNVYYYAAP